MNNIILYIILLIIVMYVLKSNTESFIDTGIRSGISLGTRRNIRAPAQTAQSAQSAQPDTATQTAQPDTAVQTLPPIQTFQSSQSAASADISYPDIETPGIKQTSIIPSGIKQTNIIPSGIKQTSIDRDTTTFNLPKGVIVAWYSEVVPVGWALCDGTNGTPNLQGRFILGSNMGRSIGTIGGAETVKLTISQIPAHSHNLLLNTACFKDGGCDSRKSVDGTNIKYDAFKEKQENYQPQSTGGSKPHENMPPFYTLTYIMKL